MVQMSHLEQVQMGFLQFYILEEGDYLCKIRAKLTAPVFLLGGTGTSFLATFCTVKKIVDVIYVAAVVYCDLLLYLEVLQ